MSINKPPSSYQTQSQGLPEPDQDSLVHSQHTLTAIKAMIQSAQGKISFQQFMQAALFEPGLGYYRCGTEKFGQLGDFITAPEVSPFFGQCLANVIAQTSVGREVLEVGAGSGQLAISMLNGLNDKGILPDTYYILELSSELRERQQRNIHAALPELVDRVIWLDDLPKSFKGVVVANELLDAMPVKRFKLDNNEVFEEFVVWKNDKLAYTYVPASDPRLLARVEELKQTTTISEVTPYYSEVNFIAEDWIRSLASSIDSGVVLIVDYGYPRSSYYHAQRSMGTLMCHYQHRAHSDPLILPGIQDITAHIDFTAMADAAIEGGMEVVGFASQAHFLLNTGILSLIDPQQQELPDFLQASGEIKRLTLPGEMGESFKVMAFTKNYEGDVTGFEQHDIRHLL
ncbi:MAG: SAM-dependent methyltransferase [Thioalkalispiraceae bacterium]|jgi:SAM-dependent MidA family methyltransferase